MRVVQIGRRFRGVLVVAFLLPASAGRGEEGPSGDDLAGARKALAEDDLAKAVGAIAVVARAGGAGEVADFGARTRHVLLSHEAGKALAGLGAEKAEAELRRLRGELGKQPFELARVAVMASYLAGPEGLRILSELAVDPRDRVAVHAIRGLRGRPAEETRPLLLRLLKSKRDDVAGAAAVGLGDLPSDEDTNEALFKLASKGDLVGGLAAYALTRIEGTESYGDRAFRMLGQRASDESFHALAKVALWKSKDPGKEEFEKAFRSPVDEVREVACDLIGLRKLEGYQKRLLGIATGDKSWRTRVAAWLALRRAGIGDVLEEVRKQIRAKQEPSYWAIQCAAAWPDEGFVEALREAALDPEDQVRRTLAQLALARDAARVQATRAFYLEVWEKSRGKPEGQATLMGLGHLRDPETFKALVGLLEKEKKKELQLWILKGLEKLTGHYYAPDPGVWNEWFHAVGGKVAYESRKLDRNANREQAAKTDGVGLSAESEAAVERGLSWLVRHQDLSGGWDGRGYDRNCLAGAKCLAKNGVKGREPGYTGLVLLALQGAGHRHFEGPYGGAARAGFAYIVARSGYDGSHEEREWTFCYESSIVCHALCDGHALTADPWLALAGQRMIDYLVKIQYPGRAWRYAARDAECDTSVLSWVVMACVSARNAGLDVPDQMLAGAEAWFDKACDAIPPDTYEVFSPDEFGGRAGRYSFDVSKDERGHERTFKLKTWYQPPRMYTSSTPAVGLLSRIWLGWTRAHPFCVGSANQLLGQTPRYNEGLTEGYTFYPYTWYYGSLAMYQMGGPYWARWREECLGDLMKHQGVQGCRDGAWTIPSNECFVGCPDAGTVYSTAMAVLALESFYRYLPYLSRFEPSPELGK